VRDHQDVATFLTTLAITCERFAWRIFAWCMMPNHYHLVVETLQPTLSRGMLRQNSMYAQHFNRRHGRVGHLFQARYKAFIVQRERYLLTLLRYVELNPCRARLVQDPADWPWSSVHVSLGHARPPSWCGVRQVWRRFGISQAEAIAGYRAFLHEAAVQPPPGSCGVFIGNETFAEEVRKRFATFELSPEIPQQQRERRPTFAQLAAAYRDRDQLAKAAYLAGYPLQDIASRLGLHYSTVSRIAQRDVPRSRRRIDRSRPPVLA
jgi:REP element-mobilizing transposase RayT